GRLLARYRKVHLFDVDLPGRVSVRESDTRAPGSDLVTVATGLGTLGLSICYDLRFPELYRGLAARGAEILLVPSAFTFPTGAAAPAPPGSRAPCPPPSPAPSPPDRTHPGSDGRRPGNRPPRTSPRRRSSPASDRRDLGSPGARRA